MEKVTKQLPFFMIPLYTYKTTIAGQIFIAMWAERMVQCGTRFTIYTDKY